MVPKSLILFYYFFSVFYYISKVNPILAQIRRINLEEHGTKVETVRWCQGTRTKEKMIDTYPASNNSVCGVFKGTDCTLGLCRYLFYYVYQKQGRTIAMGKRGNATPCTICCPVCPPPLGNLPPLPPPDNFPICPLLTMYPVFFTCLVFIII